MKQKNDTFAQTLVGVFMLTVLLLLGYFTIIISGADLLSGRSRARLTIAFEQVGGLKDHDNVMYRGTKVGTVERITVTSSNLVVTALVDGGVVLRTGYRATVCSLSMLGGNYLLLEEGLGEPVDLSTTVFCGETPTDWMADMSKITRNLRDLTDRIEINGIITNLEAASASARIVASRVERGEGLIGRLTTADDQLYADLKSTVANAREISSKLSRGKIYDDLEATLANARQISENLGRRKLYDDLDAAIADFRRTCGAISAASDGVDLKGTISKAYELMDNLNTVAAKLRNGEGTLGRITSDDALYREIDGLIRDVRQVVDNYRDTTPISTFSSLAIGAF